jgi:hypothetical protein
MSASPSPPPPCHYKPSQIGAEISIIGIFNALCILLPLSQIENWPFLLTLFGSHLLNILCGIVIWRKAQELKNAICVQLVIFAACNVIGQLIVLFMFLTPLSDYLQFVSVGSFTPLIFITVFLIKQIKAPNVLPWYTIKANVDEECCICCESLLHDEVIELQQCKHYFHKTCLQTWFTSKSSCPLCRVYVDF